MGILLDLGLSYSVECLYHSPCISVRGYISNGTFAGTLFLGCWNDVFVAEYECLRKIVGVILSLVIQLMVHHDL